MTGLADFSEFIRRIRAGDESAAWELVQRYEPLIRREIRLQIDDSPLARSLDSMDVSQSVLASFFVRAAAGEYDLQDPGQLARLLMKMARNKLASSARWQFRAKRDSRRVDVGPAAIERLPDRGESPSECVSGEELLRKFREKLSDEERRISELRTQGTTWDRIASLMGGTTHARRMQLTRAIDRVVAELGLDEG